MKALIVAAVIALAAPAMAQVVATDGDSLKVHGQSVRLFGLDAPELAQTCGAYQAGLESRNALSGLIRGLAVACEHVTTDRYGRSVSVCRAAGRDIGAEMVRSGRALAFTRYSRLYLPEESEARAAGRGMHPYACLAPWDWRAERRR